MIDFHIHIGSSSMLPSEALRYAARSGIRAAGLIMRDDGSGLDRLKSLAAEVRRSSLFAGVEAFIGVELVHVPPALLPEVVAEARRAGAQLVLVHGESLNYGVDTGTNHAAIEAGADILAHPGLLDARAAAWAAERGVALELSSCPRHGLSNGHVAAMAARFGCALVPGSNARTPEDLLERISWDEICQGAGMTQEEQGRFHSSARLLVKKLMKF